MTTFTPRPPSPRKLLAAGSMAASLLAAPSLAVAADPPAAQAACQMQLVGELPVTVYDGMPTIDAQIDGHAVRMLVDTGSDATLLFRSGAKQLGLALRRLDGVTFYGAGGSDQAASARVTSFKIGGLSASNYDLLVVGRSDMGPVQGVLGAHFLTQFDVEFDIPEGKIRFFRPKGCVGDQVVYWGAAYTSTALHPAPDDGLYVTVQVNGVPVQAQMDSGAGVSVMTPEGAAKVGVTPKSEGMAADGDSVGIGAQKVDTYVGVFPTFAFGDETIRNARLRIADLFRAAKEVPLDSHIAVSVVDTPRMLLGADFFESHRIYIARGQHRVYASYMGKPVFKTRRAASPPAAK